MTNLFGCSRGWIFCQTTRFSVCWNCLASTDHTTYYDILSYYHTVVVHHTALLPIKYVRTSTNNNQLSPLTCKQVVVQQQQTVVLILIIVVWCNFLLFCFVSINNQTTCCRSRETFKLAQQAPGGLANDIANNNNDDECWETFTHLTRKLDSLTSHSRFSSVLLDYDNKKCS